MREIRDSVTLVCFVAFSIVASLAALKTIQAGLPETPSSTGAALLIAHLSEVDLADEGRPLKRHMARRVMHDLNDEVDWQSEIAALTEPQKKRDLPRSPGARQTKVYQSAGRRSDALGDDARSRHARPRRKRRADDCHGQLDESAEQMVQRGQPREAQRHAGVSKGVSGTVDGPVQAQHAAWHAMIKPLTESSKNSSVR
jgi:hypothetical protein